MSNSRRFLVLVVGLLAMVLILPLSVSAMGADHDTQPVYEFIEETLSLGPEISGATSKLTRNDNGITVQVKTSALEPGDTFTIWFIIFNNPAACETAYECNAFDLGPRGGHPDVNSSVAFATGHIVGNNGKGNFGGHLSVGDTSGLHPAFGGTPGLVDARGAEIHIIVRSHGQPIPGQVNEQISTFLGGCDVNACVDVQAAVHTP